MAFRHETVQLLNGLIAHDCRAGTAGLTREKRGIYTPNSQSWTRRVGCEVCTLSPSGACRRMLAETDLLRRKEAPCSERRPQAMRRARELRRIVPELFPGHCREASHARKESWKARQFTSKNDRLAKKRDARNGRRGAGSGFAGSLTCVMIPPAPKPQPTDARVSRRLSPINTPSKADGKLQAVFRGQPTARWDSRKDVFCGVPREQGRETATTARAGRRARGVARVHYYTAQASRRALYVRRGLAKCRNLRMKTWYLLWGPRTRCHTG